MEIVIAKLLSHSNFKRFLSGTYTEWLIINVSPTVNKYYRALN